MPGKSPLPIAVETLLQQAIRHHRAGQLQEAERLYRTVLQAQPLQADANHNLGMIACQVGQHVAGLPFLKTAWSINPSREQFLLAYVDVLLTTGSYQEAHQTLQNAMKRGLGSAAAQTIQEKILDATQNRAVTESLAPEDMQRLVSLFNSGHFAEMESTARILIKQHPHSGIAWKACGTALLKQRKDALQVLQQAATLLPDDAQTFCNLGNALKDNRRSTEAICSYCRSLEITPDFVEAYFSLGRTQQDNGQLEDALTSYRRALQIKPDFLPALCNLLFAIQFSRAINKAQLFAAHRSFGQLVEPPLKPHWPTHANSPAPEKRLKIGYVSGDFRHHPVAYFFEPILTNHDKSQVEVFCYSNSTMTDVVTHRFIVAADHWQSCVNMSDDELAKHIIADGIDILVDLSGHTANNRLLTFARKPAPIQITYLGYPGSSGLSAMDYRITDVYTEPGDDAFYSEKLMRLPGSLWCYRPPDDIPEVTPLPALANGYLTFGSFNNFNKINRECIGLWANMLRQLPTARLLIATVPEGDARIRLTKQFMEHGIANDRIAYYGSLPTREFQRALQEVDITLDPFPVNGATTTCESLWLGVPVLGLVGDRFLSRAGLSVLNAAGFPEFATATQDDFINKAISLAEDIPKLAEIRARMREKLKSSPLLDQVRFTQNLEGAYRQMWQQYVSGKSNSSI